jgi:4-alpha-glucanotransferase
VVPVTDRWGIAERYVDASGTERVVRPETVDRLRAVIGEPDPTPVPLVVRPGDRARLGPGMLQLEQGSTTIVADRLPPDVPLGYHSFTGSDGAERLVIVAPARCHLPPGGRAWGWAVQLYAARSAASWGIGDLADLAALTRWSRGCGAGFVLVNPLGAVAPVGAQQPSPYFPASRRFRNPLYLHPPDVPGGSDDLGVVGDAARAARALNDLRTIDRDEAWRLKLGALEAIWTSHPPLGEFERWRAEQPPALEQFAIWSVLCEQHGPTWRRWPADCRTPDGPGVNDAAARRPGRVAFYAWLQWLAGRQLATASGQGTAVIEDLPIGVDPDGFDAWAWQDSLALDVTVGAPPDEFSRRGQDWGLPPLVPWRLARAGYTPFVESVRASMAAGGGLRVDHVMGLSRLWWIPAGADPTEGAYVHYPVEDLLAILALESHRAGAVVIGEDLGTVDASFRRLLADHDVLSYRLLWFEQEEPRRWPAKAMAAVTTHDLPTVAGLWDGSDLETQRRLGLEPNQAGSEQIRARLADGAGLPADAGPADAVLGAYRRLAQAPSRLLTATLEDAVAEPERPNIPGADGRRPNWSMALPVPLEQVENHPTAVRLARLLSAAVTGDTRRHTESRSGTEPEPDR